MKMKIILFSVLMNCVFIISYSQSGPDELVLAKIKTAGYQQSQVKQMLYTLSDTYGQRLTGSREYLAAAKWASGKMKEIGLENIRLENFCNNCRGWDVKSFNVEMQYPNYMHINAYPLAWTKGSNGMVEGELVNIESYADLNSMKARFAGKLKGKIILLGKETQPAFISDTIFKRLGKEELKAMEDQLTPLEKQMPMQEQLVKWRKEYYEDSAFLQFVENEGALAILKSSPSVSGILRVSGTYYYQENEPKPLPYFSVMPEHFGRLIRLLKQNITPRIKLNLETVFYNEPENNVNIIGEIAGSDATLKSEVLLVGGHFDCWHSATGATDNGVNCMVWMEALRILKQSGLSPKRTIRVAFWGGEEEDFNGSLSYAIKNYGELAKPNSESSKVTAYLNLDNGAGAIRGVYLQGNEFARPVFERIFNRFAPNQKYYITIENTLSTDHETFDNYNIPSFQFIQDPLSYESVNHHTTLDLPEYAPEPDLMKNATILAWTIYAMASDETMVPRKQKN